MTAGAEAAGDGRASLSRTVGLVTVALVAFAANSLLCRAALATGAADAVGFTLLRLASGAAALWLILVLRERARGATRPATPVRDWRMALALTVYMAGFSMGYVALATGTGALVLFGAVQMTMLSAALVRGERFGFVGWTGLALAAGGLVWLLLPGLDAPSLAGSVPMALAGLGWGVYSLLGRGASDPLAGTTGNFALSALMALPWAGIMLASGASALSLAPEGVALALASGALASGGGYVVWYAALPHLSAGRAATVQLAVPVIAALAGVLLLGEALTSRLILAGALVIGGVALALRRPTMR